jgi:hypothetical protein
MMQYSASTSERGVIERYIRDYTRELYNARAANPKPYRLEPQFAAESALEVVRALIIDQDIREWQAVNVDGQNKKFKEANEQRGIRNAIRRERLQSFKEIAAPENRFESKPEPMNLVALAKRPALAERSRSDMNARSSTASIQTSPIDPALLEPSGEPSEEPSEDSLRHFRVSESELELLQGTLFPTQGDESPESIAPRQAGEYETASMITEEADRLLFGTDDGTGTEAVSSERFIECYAKIHIVRNTNFAREWPVFLKT